MPQSFQFLIIYHVVLNIALGALALLSLVLLLWQWFVAVRFPLHRRIADPSFSPAVTLLKPLKGCDSSTEDSLRSWFVQEYAGPIQILFGVASADDPVCAIVRKLISEYPAKDAQLIVCGPLAGANAKVSKLIELEKLAKHDVLVISDADVRVPSDFLANLVAPFDESRSRRREENGTSITGEQDANEPKPDRLLEQEKRHRAAALHDAGATDCTPLPPRGRGVRQPYAALAPASWQADDSSRSASQPSSSSRIGLVNCFYQLANPSTLAMQWEAVAINADFWSQVLQAQSLKPIDFALGAVMATRKQQLAEIGGFTALADCLADDYQLGNRLVRKGYRIAISPVPVECWSEPMSWSAVWKHQLRWGRTIRVCQPLPYFFSILSNPTLWPVLWLVGKPSPLSISFAVICFILRIVTALDLQRRLSDSRVTHHASRITFPPWLPLLKDLLQTAIWLLAFLGNHVEWRGQRMRLRPDGTLTKPQTQQPT